MLSGKRDIDKKTGSARTVISCSMSVPSLMEQFQTAPATVCGSVMPVILVLVIALGGGFQPIFSGSSAAGAGVVRLTTT
jgi:hypothetical protein